MLALTDDMFIYVCLSLRMMKARGPIITRAVPKSFVALFRWGVGRSRGPRGGTSDSFSLLVDHVLWACCCACFALAPPTPPPVCALNNQIFFMAVVLCHDMNIFRQSRCSGFFRICCHKVDPFKSLIVCLSAWFVFTGIDCLHLWHDRDNTRELVWFVE